ncbi:unnamed protein product [Owenia fusiformis]|uniref:Uncharacterized protein n=1 Tax=Owenia fusiformis TaxID=6347 RepID=A0A8J1TV15_OWEFU|nr:unnamed protein product [Owenia fusiformis]
MEIPESSEPTQITNKVQYNNAWHNSNGTMVQNITDEEPSQIYERQVEVALWIYISPVLIILGTIGNGLTILLLQRKKMRSSSWSQYLTALAVADLTVLYTGLLGEWIRNLTHNNVDVQTLSNPGCKMYLFMMYASIHSSAWILVAVTLDRVIFVYFPIRAKYLCTVRMAKYCLLGMLVAIVALNVHFFWTFHLKHYGGLLGSTCYAKEDYYDFWLDTWPMLDSFVASYFPFLIMLISNILIIGRLLYARHQRIAMTGATQNSTSMTQVTVMLLTVNFVFLFCTAPIVLLLQVFINDNATGAVNESSDAQLSLARAALTLLQYTNNSTNFICYCISGPRFRKELVYVLCGHRERNNPSISQGNSHHTVNDGKRNRLSRKLTMTEFLRNSTKGRRSNGNTAYAKVESASSV